MDTYVYIDGFNFYYGAVKDTKYKWLDLNKMCQMLLPKHNIVKIKYFTAIVSGRKDPDQPLRQKSYIRALKSFLPNIEVFEGKFLSHPVTMPLEAPNGSTKYARVIKTEEKGSDVNLAIHMINDAWKDLYECAVLISNDSDLAGALEIVKCERKKLVGVINPHKHHFSQELIHHAHFKKPVRESVLQQCLLPDNIPGTNIRIPQAWK
jgi:uncharacterized LabA/DUF88 family protein